MPSNFANDESSPRNPYQAPQTLELLEPFAQKQPEPPPASTKQRAALWVISPATLPPTCVLCNQPVDPRSYRTRQLSYFNPWLYLLLCLPPIYFFVMIAERKNCEVTYGYCESHQRRRIWKVVVSSLLSLLALSWISWLLFQVISSGEDKTIAEFIPALLACYSFIPALILFVVCYFHSFTQHRLVACEYSAGQFGLRGFGREFLYANVPGDSSGDEHA